MATVPARTRTGVRTAVVWDYLTATLDELGPAGTTLRILDAGGGSGGFAVPLAQLGHHVTVVAANRIAAVVARVASGRLGEARRLLSDPAGYAGAGDPLLRRFTLDELQLLLGGAGLQVQTVHGVRVFADAVPPSLLDGGDPQAVE